MRHKNWEKGVIRDHPRLEAELLAQKLGMTYEYKSADRLRTSHLSGDYLGRTLSIELKQPVSLRSKYYYSVKCSVELRISTQVKVRVQEKLAIIRFFQPSIPIAQQTGTNLINAQYKTEGYPQPFVDGLLQSPDFCYSTLLLSASTLELIERHFFCKYTGQHAYAFEVPLMLERFYLIASSIEIMAMKFVNTKDIKEK